MRPLRVVLLPLLLAPLAHSGCFNPAPLSGAYRCDPSDNGCPPGQHCTCGLCVNQDRDAACSFKVELGPGAATRGVSEHEQFPVTITALMHDMQTPASGFNGTVQLRFSLPNWSVWCDVTPSRLPMQGGRATASVSLNRETIRGQVVRLTAEAGSAVGRSANIAVSAPKFNKDATPVIPAASSSSAFGWADVSVSQPNVVRDGNGFRMYFVGIGSTQGEAIGMATSSDGRSFAPRAMPVMRPVSQTFCSYSVTSPSVFTSGDGLRMAFAGQDRAQFLAAPSGSDIGMAHSTDGQNFNLPRPDAILKRDAFAYCTNSVAFPTVLRDPVNPATDGGAGGWLMFFSAVDAQYFPSIGRASSLDGSGFVPEPAPVLTGDVGGEIFLFAPQVVVDGTVFKMWYAYTRNTVFLDICHAGIQIGYATSNDGFYWIRSPSNPVVSLGGGGWDSGSLFLLPGSAVVLDSSSSIAIYYSALVSSGGQCRDSGIGRAVRP